MASYPTVQGGREEDGGKGAKLGKGGEGEGERTSKMGGSQIMEGGR